MEQVETKVDVLAVVDATIKLAQEGYIPEHHEVVALEQARAAIAELIEAAREASATLGHIYHTTPLPQKLEQYAHDGYQRLDAAIANVGGGK